MLMGSAKRCRVSRLERLERLEARTGAGFGLGLRFELGHVRWLRSRTADAWEWAMTPPNPCPTTNQVNPAERDPKMKSRLRREAMVQPRIALACTLVSLLSACAHSTSHAPASSPERAAVTTVEVPVPEPAPAREPFSGEIVYRMTLFPRDNPSAPRELGEMHYFISGRHWKDVDAKGHTIALYDPDTHLVHYFEQGKVIDVTRPEDSATFDAPSEVKVVLGRRCKAVRWKSAHSTSTAFYDPALFADPRLFANHHHGHWAETLAFTGGGISLWSKQENEWGDIVMEAQSVEPRTFPPSFWSVAEAERAAASGGVR